jgi:hypothetical protein
MSRLVLLLVVRGKILVLHRRIAILEITRPSFLHTDVLPPLYKVVLSAPLPARQSRFLHTPLVVLLGALFHGTPQRGLGKFREPTLGGASPGRGVGGVGGEFELAPLGRMGHLLLRGGPFGGGGSGGGDGRRSSGRWDGGGDGSRSKLRNCGRVLND